ncbi:MAG: response regulator [Cyclobacteriaceae bacterium]
MKTALIIEDNLDIRENTTEILELAGYKVVSVTNGREGIQAAVTTTPDIILCDIMMPEVNGYDVIKELKKNPQTAKIPFIYVTASAERKEVKLAMDMGADGYVRKPFDVRELMEIIDQALSR